jgi:hypothetical protein
MSHVSHEAHDELHAAVHPSLLLRKVVVDRSATTGGRAVFASADARAGELLAAECPTMEHLFAIAGECQHVSLARRILDLPDSDPRWACVRLLHPRSLDAQARPVARHVYVLCSVARVQCMSHVRRFRSQKCGPCMRIKFGLCKIAS